MFLIAECNCWFWVVVSLVSLVWRQIFVGWCSGGYDSWWWRWWSSGGCEWIKMQSNQSHWIIEELTGCWWCWDFTAGVVGSVCATVRSTSIVVTTICVVGAVWTTVLSGSSICAAVWAWTAIFTAVRVVCSINATEFARSSVGALGGRK